MLRVTLGRRDMSCELEYAADEAAVFAEAAREVIDARLRDSPVLRVSDFWRVVAKVYARDLPNFVPGEQDRMRRDRIVELTIRERRIGQPQLGEGRPLLS